MRLPAAAASILAMGLIVAACGGDEATSEPGDEATPAPAATEVAEEPADETTEGPTDAPAEEPSEAPAEEPTEEATAEPEFGTKAATSNEDDPEATYALTSGRYRMQWSSTDCDQVDFLVSQIDGDFTYPRTSTASFASATINDMPEGHYKVEQLDAACAVWSVRIDRMSA
jgi:hypothetical protein